MAHGDKEPKKAPGALSFGIGGPYWWALDNRKGGRMLHVDVVVDFIAKWGTGKPMACKSKLGCLIGVWINIRNYPSPLSVLFWMILKNMCKCQPRRDI